MGRALLTGIHLAKSLNAELRAVPTENSIQRFSTQCNIVTFSSPIWLGLTFIFFMPLISKPLPPDGVFGRDRIPSWPKLGHDLLLSSGVAPAELHNVQRALPS